MKGGEGGGERKGGEGERRGTKEERIEEGRRGGDKVDSSFSINHFKGTKATRGHSRARLPA